METAAGAASLGDDSWWLQPSVEACEELDKPDHLESCKIALWMYNGRSEDEPSDQIAWLKAKVAFYHDKPSYCVHEALEYLSEFGGTLEEATKRFHDCKECAKVCMLGGLSFTCDHEFFFDSFFGESRNHNLSDFPGMSLPANSGYPDYHTYHLDMELNHPAWNCLPKSTGVVYKQATHNTEVPPSRDSPSPDLFADFWKETIAKHSAEVQEIRARQNAEAKRARELREAAENKHLSDRDTDDDEDMPEAD